MKHRLVFLFLLLFLSISSFAQMGPKPKPTTTLNPSHAKEVVSWNCTVNESATTTSTFVGIYRDISTDERYNACPYGVIKYACDTCATILNKPCDTANDFRTNLIVPEGAVSGTLPLYECTYKINGEVKKLTQDIFDIIKYYRDLMVNVTFPLSSSRGKLSSSYI